MAQSIQQLVGALWIAGGAVTYALSEVAHVLGRTGQRLYAYDGGHAQILGATLILAGLGMLFKEFIQRRLSIQDEKVKRDPAEERDPL